jgi:hypothetical protein
MIVHATSPSLHLMLAEGSYCGQQLGSVWLHRQTFLLQLLGPLQAKHNTQQMVCASMLPNTEKCDRDAASCICYFDVMLCGVIATV